MTPCRTAYSDIISPFDAGFPLFAPVRMILGNGCSTLQLRGSSVEDRQIIGVHITKDLAVRHTPTAVWCIFLPFRKVVIIMQPRLACLALLIVVTAAVLAGTVPHAQAQTGEWKQLFDGKDLVGWKHVGPGQMTIEDGVIHTHGGMGLLYWTGGTLGDCVIRLVYKMRDHN